MTTVATAIDEAGREIRVTQDEPGAPVTYAVPDGRFDDGYRPVTDPDELADLIGSINAAQIEAAEVAAQVAAATEQALAEATAEAEAIDDPEEDPEP